MPFDVLPMDEPEFKLTIRPLPTRPGEPDPLYRLRGALKVLLRRFRLRCTRIDVVEGGSQQKDYQFSKTLEKE